MSSWRGCGSACGRGGVLFSWDVLFSVPSARRQYEHGRVFLDDAFGGWQCVFLPGLFWTVFLLPVCCSHGRFAVGLAALLLPCVAHHPVLLLSALPRPNFRHHWRPSHSIRVFSVSSHLFVWYN